MDYSQNNEQEVILKYFGGYVGRLLSIGENDGQTFSNTRALIERGWEGVLVEPSPGAFNVLQRLYEGHRDVRCIQAAIGTESGFVTLHDGADSLVSSLYAEKTKVWNTPITEREVPCLTVRDLLLLNPGPYDFITIDTEGMDWDILQQIDLTEVKLVCAEYVGDGVEKYIAYCERFGMREIYRCYENIIMGK